MTCQFIAVIPGQEGEGVEIHRCNRAAWLIDGVPCCERCFKEIDQSDYDEIERLPDDPA